MATLQYSNYKGFGDWAKTNIHYSQAVRIGDRIECSGQGGWDRATHELPNDIAEQTAIAFDNVQHTLEEAGLKGGWEHVYKVRTYHVPLNDEAMKALTAELRRWCPNHQPVLTAVGVTRLGFDAMKIEVEVEAYAP